MSSNKAANTIKAILIGIIIIQLIAILIKTFNL